MKSTSNQILGPDGNPFQLAGRVGRTLGSKRRGNIQGRFDAASWTAENKYAWSQADGLSSRAANSKEVRYRLRIRCRYEIANSSFAHGIVNTLANDTIGTGPRLQLLTEDPELNGDIEREFGEWSRAIGLAHKLRTMRLSLSQDGEAFALFINNPRLPTEVQLDLMLVEADQCSTPYLDPLDPLAVDGIRFDLEGNPVVYSFLRRHPGDTYQIGLVADDIDARSVIHWFRIERPGQRRGIPEITPALDLFNQLRRYILAVIEAAELAAKYAAVVESQLPPDGEADLCEPFENLEVERGTMVTLPAGWKMNQFRPEQPSANLKEFIAEIEKQICRCLHMPLNIASGDSSGYNYASGRLDHQVYDKSIRIDQASVEQIILDRVLNAWIEEAWLATNLIPGGSSPRTYFPREWFWDGREHVDPLKEANAQEKRLASNTTTLANEYAKQGLDWEDQIRQRAREIKLMKELEIPPYPPAPVPLIPGPGVGVGSSDPGDLDESDEPSED